MSSVTSAALLRDIVQDLRVGVRGLVRHAGFTVTAMFVLACGIGLSVAILSVANVVPGRPLPVADETRLVASWGDATGSARRRGSLCRSGRGRQGTPA